MELELDYNINVVSDIQIIAHMATCAPDWEWSFAKYNGLGYKTIFPKFANGQWVHLV